MEVFVAQLLNGLVYGVLLFLIAAGLTLVFGVMDFINATVSLGSSTLVWSSRKWPLTRSVGGRPTAM